MPATFPVTLTNEAELIAFLANYSTKEFYMLATERIYPAIKAAQPALPRGRTGPRTALLPCYYDDGRQLTSSEFNKCQIGQQLWRFTDDGMWVVIHKARVGREVHWIWQTARHRSPPFSFTHPLGGNNSP